MRNDTRDVELSDDTMGVPIIVKLPVCMPTVQASVRASGGGLKSYNRAIHCVLANRISANSCRKYRKLLELKNDSVYFIRLSLENLECVL